MSEDFFDRDKDHQAGNGYSRDGYNPHKSYNRDNRPSRYGHQDGNAPRPRFTRSSRYDEGGTPSGTAPRRYDYRPRYQDGGSGRFSNQDSDREGGTRQFTRHDDAEPRRFFRTGNGYQPRENRWGKQRYGSQDRFYGDSESRGHSRPQYSDNYTSGERRYGSSRYETDSDRPYSRPRFQQNGPRGARPQGRGGYDSRTRFTPKKRFEYKEENIDPNQPVRLNKYLANAGVCSRRDADKYIEAGVVTVNGTVVTELGTKVLRSDEVRFHDNRVTMEKKVYVLLNKPKGYVTTSEDPQNRKTVMDLVAKACPERIYPVGRLDRNTTGVLLLTNDGDLASKLTHPKFLKKKIYHVTTDQPVSSADMRQISEGITLEDGEIKADAIEYADETDRKQIGIEIHSGKNRIVRRIFESLGYHVVKLDRVYFAGLTKKNVRRGDWRYLTEKEVNMLRMGAFD